MRMQNLSPLNLPAPILSFKRLVVIPGKPQFLK